MTASLVSRPLPLSLNTWFNQSYKRAVLPVRIRTQSREMLEERGFECDQSDGFPEFDQNVLWQKMLEAMPQGVLVMSRSLEVLYCNSQAKDLCEQLRELEEHPHDLPSLIVELCQRFLTSRKSADETLVMEAQGRMGGIIRSRVQWMSFSADVPPILLILMEDYQAVLLEARILEQKKYELTDREAEVWGLICQHYTYQEISDTLRISMNTVKTHVKNVYAKRKNVGGQRRIWYSR